MLIENLSNDVTEMKATLKNISEKPAKNWDAIIKNTISAVIGGVIAFVFYKFGLSK
jgi:hypothetical protein